LPARIRPPSASKISSSSTFLEERCVIRGSEPSGLFGAEQTWTLTPFPTANNAIVRIKIKSRKPAYQPLLVRHTIRLEMII
jgi:hypothetical protein